MRSGDNDMESWESFLEIRPAIYYKHLDKCLALSRSSKPNLLNGRASTATLLWQRKRRHRKSESGWWMGHLSCLTESTYIISYKFSLEYLSHTYTLPQIRYIWFNIFSQTWYICVDNRKLKNHHIPASQMPSWAFQFLTILCSYTPHFIHIGEPLFWLLMP